MFARSCVYFDGPFAPGCVLVLAERSSAATSARPYQERKLLTEIASGPTGQDIGGRGAGPPPGLPRDATVSVRHIAPGQSDVSRADADAGHHPPRYAHRIGDTIPLMPGLNIQSHELSNGWLSIGVEGEIDFATVNELKSAIDGAFDDSTDRLVVDLSGSSFMDSTGLKTLVMSNRLFEDAGRSFAVAVKGGPVARLIDLSGINTTIRMVETVDDLD